MGCRRRAPQRELVRIARTPSGDLVASRTAPGRGAWLCAGSVACIDEALKRRAFSRALRGDVRPEAVEALRRSLHWPEGEENVRDLPVAGYAPSDGTEATKG